MALADQDVERLFDEECPGPIDLGSVLVHDPISNAANHPPIIVEAQTPLVEVLEEDPGGRSRRRANRPKWQIGRIHQRDVLLRVAGFQSKLCTPQLAPI